MALLRLPACDGRRCIAHAALVKMLFMVIIIASVYTSVNQGSTDLSVRRGLAGLSAFPLHGVPCARPAPSPTMAAGPSRDPRCRAPASCTQRGLALHRVLAGPGHAVWHRRLHGPWSGAAPWPRPPSPRGRRARARACCSSEINRSAGGGSCWGLLALGSLAPCALLFQGLPEQE